MQLCAFFSSPKERIMIAPGKHKVRSYYRPTKAPTISIPFGLRSVAYNITGKDWQDHREIKHFTQLFWTVRGTGQFTVNNQQYDLPENHAFFYRQGDEHIIKTISRVWEYRFLTIDGNMQSTILEGFNFPRHPIEAGPCPDDLFIKLESQVKDITPSGQRQAAATAYTIISLVAGYQQDKSTPPIIDEALGIMQAQYQDPNLNINTIAGMLNIHRSRLSKLFHEITGITLIDYLISLRIHTGLSLLKETTLTISEIADKTGYSNPDYFAKAVKKATGKSPKLFRQ
jgi:AraC-like DNA-binding protein/mannose-6-phosphate isomerase-like protein (cupin superfamily)